MNLVLELYLSIESNVWKKYDEEMTTANPGVLAVKFSLVVK